MYIFCAVKVLNCVLCTLHDFRDLDDIRLQLIQGQLCYDYSGRNNIFHTVRLNSPLYEKYMWMKQQKLQKTIDLIFNYKFKTILLMSAPTLAYPDGVPACPCFKSPVTVILLLDD